MIGVGHGGGGTVCFVLGTHILTTIGEVPVERLVEGDVAVLAEAGEPGGSLVASFARSNAVVAALAHRAGDRWHGTEDLLLARLVEQFGAGEQTMSMTALITTGTRPT